MYSESTVSPSSASGNDSYAKNRPILFLSSLVVIACGSWLAFSQTFQGFSRWDDEGYMIMSLLHYVRQGGLYTRTFTEYGPFYFYVQQTLHTLLHLPVSHDGGRILTLLYWIASSATAWFITYRLTRHALLSSVAFLATVLMAMVLKNEPGHPDELILLLTEIALGLAVLVRSEKSTWVLLLTGAVGAFLTLTKINIGIFFLAAVSFSCVSLMPRGTLRNVLFFLGAIPALLMPIVLMRLYLAVWAKHYCELATASIALLLWTSWRLEVEDPWQPRDLLFALGGILLAASMILGIALAQGLSPSSLLDGIILLPLRHPAVLYIPLYISAPRMIMAAILLLTMTICWRFKGKLAIYSNLLGFIKVVSGVALVLTLFLRLNFALVVTLPLLPLLYWRTENQASGFENNRLTDLFPRLMLSAMIAFQFLQAYPVAGDQLFIAFAPAAIWACVLIFDGFCDVTRPGKQPFSEIVSWLKKPVLVSALTLCFAGSVLLEAHSYFRPHNSGALLHFPGAGMIHVSQRDARIYNQLVSEIREHCDVLFTMPGMNSLNLWSSIPTPNGHNVGPWMTIFTRDEQNEIVQILRGHSHPCVVYNSRLLQFWMPAGPEPLKESPIARYVESETQTIAQISNYELRTPKAPELRSPSTPQPRTNEIR